MLTISLMASNVPGGDGPGSRLQLGTFSLKFLPRSADGDDMEPVDSRSQGMPLPPPPPGVRSRRAQPTGAPPFRGPHSSLSLIWRPCSPGVSWERSRCRSRSSLIGWQIQRLVERSALVGSDHVVVDRCRCRRRRLRARLDVDDGDERPPLGRTGAVERAARPPPSGDRLVGAVRIHRAGHRHRRVSRRSDQSKRRRARVIAATARGSGCTVARDSLDVSAVVHPVGTDPSGGRSLGEVVAVDVGPCRAGSASGSVRSWRCVSSVWRATESSDVAWAPLWLVGVVSIVPCVIVVLLAWRAAATVEEAMRVGCPAARRKRSAHVGWASCAIGGAPSRGATGSSGETQTGPPDSGGEPLSARASSRCSPAWPS